MGSLILVPARLSQQLRQADGGDGIATASPQGDSSSCTALQRAQTKLKLVEENRTDSREQALSLHKSLINISSSHT